MIQHVPLEARINKIFYNKTIYAGGTFKNLQTEETLFPSVHKSS